MTDSLGTQLKPPARPQKVAIARGDVFYASEAPYPAASAHPEFRGLGASAGGEPNPAFEGVRNALRLLELDPEHFGSDTWNPLGRLVGPGDRVLLKPNWVMHDHPHEAELGVDAARDCLVTHPSVLRAVIDYVQIALRGEGRIVLADAPLQACDFAELLRRSQVERLQDHYDVLRRSEHPIRPVAIEVKDLRLEVAERRGMLSGIGLTLDKQRRPEGIEHAVIDLGPCSALEEIAGDFEAFRVTCYDPASMQTAHHRGRHRYCVSREVLEADVVINLPKLKTHKKGGLTVALKNLVGINGHKSFLPHHRQGSPADGGDEYLASDPLKLLASVLHDATYKTGTPPWKQRLASYASSGLAAVGRFTRLDGTETGSWYGNDTLWRTCVDLNRILLYATAEGGFAGEAPSATHQRRVLHVVDGIIGGDRDGPLTPRPRPSGVILAGVSAPFVDLAAASLMGLRWERIPLLMGAFAAGPGAPLGVGRPEDLCITSDHPPWHGARISRGSALADHFEYQPAPGWEGVVEASAHENPVPLLAATRRAGWLWRDARASVDPR